MKHKHRAESDQRDGQDRLAEQVVAKRELKRARQVVLEKEPDVEEVPNRYIAQQNLSGTRQVLRSDRFGNSTVSQRNRKTSGEYPEIQDAEGNPPESGRVLACLSRVLTSMSLDGIAWREVW